MYINLYYIHHKLPGGATFSLLSFHSFGAGSSGSFARVLRANAVHNARQAELGDPHGPMGSHGPMVCLTWDLLRILMIFDDMCKMTK